MAYLQTIRARYRIFPQGQKIMFGKFAREALEKFCGPPLKNSIRPRARIIFIEINF